MILVNQSQTLQTREEVSFFFEWVLRPIVSRYWILLRSRSGKARRASQHTIDEDDNRQQTKGV